jgi:hypothetical protein
MCGLLADRPNIVAHVRCPRPSCRTLPCTSPPLSSSPDPCSSSLSSRYTLPSAPFLQRYYMFPLQRTGTQLVYRESCRDGLFAKSLSVADAFVGQTYTRRQQRESRIQTRGGEASSSALADKSLADNS